MKFYLKDVILIMIVVFVLSSVFILTSNKKRKDFSSIKVVDNSTQYYDVSSIMNKFVHNSNIKNKNVLLNMLDSNFKNEKKVTEKNIFNKVKKYSDDNITFFGDKMYYEEINKNILKVYVSGTIQSATMEGYDIIDNYYAIVLMDKSKKLFSIIPDDGKTFMEVEKWMQK